MKEFIAGLVLTLVIGGIGIAIEMQEREEVKYINADCNWREKFDVGRNYDHQKQSDLFR